MQSSVNNNTLREFIYRSPRYLLLTLTCSSTGLCLPAWAQQNDINAVEEIAVTGSRIQRSGMTTPTPVTIVTADELSLMAPGSIIDGMSQLPQFFANQTPSSANSWFTRSGYGNLNLRGLGTNRTLTLLNNRRIVSSTAFGGVDINTFPEAMIKSVETVTGGASAAYGTDAVAGATNFLLDTDFTGFRAHGQFGTTSREDADNVEGSIAFGTDVGDRGHILFSAEYFDQDGVQSWDGRNWYKAWGTVPDASNMLLIRPDVVSRNASFDGFIVAPGSAIHGLAFNSDASAAPFITSDTAGFPFGIPPARHSISNGGSGDDLNSERPNLLPDNKRDSMFLYADYELTDTLTLFGQHVQGANSTRRFNSPGGSFHGTPTALSIFQDNAFLPESIRQTMINEGLESFTFKRMGSIADLGANAEVWDDSAMNSLTLGVEMEIEGGFFDDWSVDAYYQHGENERRWYQRGLRVDRAHAAVDAVIDPASGHPVCRVTLYSNAYDGCQPLNLFGRGNASAAAIDYVTGFEPGQYISTPLYYSDTGFARGDTASYLTTDAKVNNTSMEQDLWEITANGELFAGWGAGPVSAAFGATYRDEKIRQIVHDVTNPASDHSGDFQPVR